MIQRFSYTVICKKYEYSKEHLICIRKETCDDSFQLLNKTFINYAPFVYFWVMWLSTLR